MTVSVEQPKKQNMLMQKAQIGWKSLSKLKKIVLITILSSLLIALGAYGFIFSKKNYVTLYSNMDISQAGEIKTALEESGVTDYKISDGGTSILVLENQVDRLRMDLAVSGLTPENGTGFELFDNSQLGMTEQERQIMYQRALEGELRRSIVSLEIVEDARVHLNLNEESIFSRETDPSSASVVLSLKKNSNLSEAQVQGIVALIAGAVNNLSTEYIQVIDTNGNLLSRHQSEDYTYQTAEITSQEMEYESRLEEKIQAQLGKVFGYDKIAASVRVKLNQSSEEQRSEQYTDGTVVSEQSQFNRTETDSEAEDAAGPLDNNMQNVIENNPVDDALADPSVSEFNQTNNYQPSVTETHTVKPPGEIESLSVSVIYSGEMDNDLYGLITDHVASIVGINMERGDRISVSGTPFTTPDLQVNSGQTIVTGGMDVINLVLILVGLLILILIIIVVLRKRRKAKLIYHEYDEYNQQSSSEIEEQLRQVIRDNNSEALSEDLLAQVKEIFRDHKLTTIELLNIWMQDNKADTSDSSLYNPDIVGIEKVASLLIVLGKEVTSNVMKQFNEEDVTRLVQVISHIKNVSHQQGVLLLEEFMNMYKAHQYLSQGGYDFAKEALTGAIGESAAEDILVKVKGSVRQKRPFESLRRMDTAQLLNALINEHPQTIALILCYLPTEKSAKVIAELPEQLQADVTQRIGLMSHTSSQIVDAVEGVMETRLQSLGTGDVTQIGGLGTVVDILNSVDRSTQKNILNSMQDSNADFAEEVRDNLFTFEDIIHLDNVSIQRILRDIDQSTLALALKGVSENIMAMITRNISARAVERLKEEIDYLGPVRLVEVEKAQYEIVKVIRKLEDSGEIVIGDGGDNNVVY